MSSRNHDDDDNELLSTPKSADLVDDLEGTPPRNESNNELSLLGEGLVSSGKSPGLSAFLAETADVLMPRKIPPMSMNDSSITGSSNHSNNKPGRPPRAPVQATAGSHGSHRVSNKQPTGSHRNVQSSGDYSFMSALTDASSPDDGSPHDGRRGRSVSFDQNVIGQRGLSESLLQPILTDTPDDDDMPLPQSILTGPASQLSEETPLPAVGTGIKSPEAKITLSTLIGANPLEAEAETAILRVLEEEGQDRADPDEPPEILPHLSEHDASALRTGVQDKVGVHMAIPENVDRVRVDSARSSLRASARPTGGRPPAKEEHRGSLSIRATKEEAKLRESKGLESKLIGLTLAMNRLRVQSAEEHHTAMERMGEGSDANSKDKEEDDVRTSDLFTDDAMVANANVLFRRTLGRQKGSMNLRPGQPTTVVPTTDHKKTDSDAHTQGNDTGLGIDIELGDTTAAASDGVRVPQRKTLTQQISGLFLKPMKRSAQRTGDDVKDFSAFLSRRKRGILFVVTVIGCALVIPLLGVAVLLYYAFDNPLLEGGGASVSWLLIFIARHLLIAALALASQLLTIDYLSLRRRLTVRLLGSWISLGLVQSKGLPFLLVSWSFYSLCLLSGEHRFAQHWLFWQDSIDLFNGKNPSGSITSNHTYIAILGLSMFNGIVIALKRLWWGLYVGKKSYLHFGDQVAKTIEQMVLVSEVSHLSVLCVRKKSRKVLLSTAVEKDFLDEYLDDATQRASMSRKSMASVKLSRTKPVSEHEKVIDETQKDIRTGRLTQSQKARLNQLLDEWEEPEIVNHKKARVSINAILEFRQALTFMDSNFVFSLSFGLADTRVSCVESAQRVFERLLMAKPGRRTIPFETIAFIATNEEEGSFDQAKMKALIRLFRPDRDGTLTMLDFVRSCDKVYKDMRMLRASIKNTGQINHSFELVVNWIFFLVLGIITVAVLGYDPLALFLSLSSIILAFAFMISSASSKYFEGLLFVLVRRPYDIGDRIHVSNVNSDTSAGGSPTWFVQNVDLFTTTVRFATTNEVATYSNGSLANSRIINGRRSPKAVRFVYMKFGVGVPYSKVQLFKRSVETFVKDRPREWLSMAGFRATCVEQDKGYIEYVIVLQHRESWQNIGPILNSTADVASFCLELAKRLGMRYSAPPLPVNLTMKSDEGTPTVGATSRGAAADSPDFPGMSPDLGGLAALFEKRGDK